MTREERPHRTATGWSGSARPADGTWGDLSGGPPTNGRRRAGDSLEGNGHRPPRRRRRSLVVGLAVAAVAAITVITDLPQPASRASQISDARAVMQEVNSDIDPCGYATHESFLIYGDQTAHTLTASDRSRVPGLLQDDQVACSFANDSIYDLSSNVETATTPAGKDLGDLVGTLLLWSTSDALGAIEDIQALTTRPNDRHALSDLDKREQMLGRDRREVMTDLQRADQALGTHLPAPPIPRVPSGSGGAHGPH